MRRLGYFYCSGGTCLYRTTIEYQDVTCPSGYKCIGTCTKVECQVDADCPADYYSLEASKAGYYSGDRVVSLAKGEVKSADITLKNTIRRNQVNWQSDT